MRSFIAIELDKVTRVLLSDIQKKLSDAGAKGNFTRPENLHLTIKFLGEIDSAAFDKVKTLLKKVSAGQKSFVLTMDTIGKFDRGNKKIIWAGLSWSKELEHLYSAVETEVLRILPIEKEKHFRPHITLAREAILPDTALDNIIINDEFKHSFRADGISLMESTRKDGKLIYLRRAYESFYNTET